jgi:D-alanyl-D-alanine carboxypeptidase
MLGSRPKRYAEALAANCAALLFVVAGVAGALAQQQVPVEALLRAYPDFLAGVDGKALIWKDGTRMPLSDGRDDKSFEEKLRSPSILDQLSLAYVKGRPVSPPGPQDDPGRFRNIALFDKMYGDCGKGEVQRKLVKVDWLPRSGGGSVFITSVNGVAEKLKAVSEELDRLPAEMRKYAFPSAGTYNCRAVKDTGNRSGHAWGIAIDINTRFSDYWLWAGKRGYRNRIPYEIVEIFERHGFIWGGKWGHFDTMHFEYRPELL